MKQKDICFILCSPSPSPKPAQLVLVQLELVSLPFSGPFTLQSFPMTQGAFKLFNHIFFFFFFSTECYAATQEGGWCRMPSKAKLTPRTLLAASSPGKAGPPGTTVPMREWERVCCAASAAVAAVARPAPTRPSSKAMVKLL